MPPIEPAKVRPGNKLIVEGDIYTVVDFAHTKPGKGQAFVKCKLKNLRDGRTLERTWKIGEMLETADFERRSCQFLYNDDEGYHFMDLGTFDQFSLSAEDIGLAAQFLQNEMKVVGSFFEDKPLGVELPAKVTLEVVDTIDAVRGNTASAITKEATLENGFVAQVPPFIKVGDKVVISTETGDYLERA